MNELKTQDDTSKLNYGGDLTLEALSVLETYTKQCCNKSATARKLNKQYNKVYQYLKQPYVREFFKLKLLEAGVTPQKIAQTINDGLTAENGVYFEGNKVADEPNWMARQKFAQLAAEILEVLKYQTKIENTTNTLVLAGADMAEYLKLKESISVTQRDVNV